MDAVAAALRNLPPMHRSILSALPSMQQLAPAAWSMAAWSYLAMEAAFSSRATAETAAQTWATKTSSQAGAPKAAAQT
ncbi:MAG: hypothetical protein Q4E86_11360, partial [Lachnospiraceae bacterium]|nr:hypothetical protein [Lachnospiraceae bacterium]